MSSAPLPLLSPDKNNFQIKELLSWKFKLNWHFVIFSNIILPPPLPIYLCVHTVGILLDTWGVSFHWITHLKSLDFRNSKLVLAIPLEFCIPLLHTSIPLTFWTDSVLGFYLQAGWNLTASIWRWERHLNKSIKFLFPLWGAFGDLEKNMYTYIYTCT